LLELSVCAAPVIIHEIEYGSGHRRIQAERPEFAGSVAEPRTELCGSRCAQRVQVRPTRYRRCSRPSWSSTLRR
jgi:hypothetical protein